MPISAPKIVSSTSVLIQILPFVLQFRKTFSNWLVPKTNRSLWNPWIFPDRFDGIASFAFVWSYWRYRKGGRRRSWRQHLTPRLKWETLFIVIVILWLFSSNILPVPLPFLLLSRVSPIYQLVSDNITLLVLLAYCSFWRLYPITI